MTNLEALDSEPLRDVGEQEQTARNAGGFLAGPRYRALPVLEGELSL